MEILHENGDPEAIKGVANVSYGITALRESETARGKNPVQPYEIVNLVSDKSPDKSETLGNKQGQSETMGAKNTAQPYEIVNPVSDKPPKPFNKLWKRKTAGNKQENFENVGANNTVQPYEVVDLVHDSYTEEQKSETLLEEYEDIF